MSVAGRLNVNVALNRPSYQPSVYQGTRYPSLANDGSTSTSAAHCMATNTQTDPWWAVDLLVQLDVAGVKFVNKYSEGRLSTRCLIALSASSEKRTRNRPSSISCRRWRRAQCPRKRLQQLKKHKKHVLSILTKNVKNIRTFRDHSIHLSSVSDQLFNGTGWHISTL